MPDAPIQQLLSEAAQNVQARRYAQAKAAYEETLRLDPEHPVAMYGLGWIAIQTGSFAEAVEFLVKAVERAPLVASYRYALGLARAGAGNLSGAVAAYQESLKLNPNSAVTCRALGTLLAQLRRFEEAAHFLKRAVDLDPTDARAWCNLGLALEDLNRREEALAALRQAQAIDPSSKLIAYHLAAMGGAASPPICPPEYVVRLFDQYADRFDDHLVQQLNYRGPQMLFEAVTRAAPGRRFEILDLGCGTGLCGVVFKPVASFLAGIDLAPGMIAQSQARGVYDQLVQADIIDGIEQLGRPFDLFLAGDLFIYVGDLANIIEAASRWLNSGGVFAFTIEYDPQVDYALRATRRYAHSVEYVRRLAADYHFDELSAERVTLRANPDVDGYVIVLQSVKPSVSF